MADYFLGVDGGQSSTTALIGDAGGRVIGRGTAGPCNHVGAEEGRQRFEAALAGSVGGALELAGLAPGVEFRAACLGFSGGPADKEALVRARIRVQNLLVTHDARIALAGATAGRPGVVVIAGTGSIGFGRNAAGETARAGGWGFVFGDEGGAFDIVRQALRAALRDEEGWGPATALRVALPAVCGVESANGVMHLFYTDAYPRSRVAAMADVVSDTARAGDAVARGVLESAGQSLASLAKAVRGQLFAAGELVSLSYAGGVFGNELVREGYRSAVIGDGNAVCEAPIHGPAEGALLEAYGLAGLTVDAGLR